MAKGRILSKEMVTIKGLAEPFEKILRLDLKSKTFWVNYPEKVIDKNIIQTNDCCSSDIQEIEKKFQNAVAVFEALSYKYETLILYHIDEAWSYKDGSGNGFIFNWGVFRKIKNKSEYGRNLFYERGPDVAKNGIWLGNNDVKDWKQIKWSQKAENFFNELSKQVADIHAKMQYFVDHLSEIDIENLKLIGYTHEEDTHNKEKV